MKLIVDKILEQNPYKGKEWHKQKINWDVIHSNKTFKMMSDRASDECSYNMLISHKDKRLSHLPIKSHKPRKVIDSNTGKIYRVEYKKSTKTWR